MTNTNSQDSFAVSNTWRSRIGNGDGKLTLSLFAVQLVAQVLMALLYAHHRELAGGLKTPDTTIGYAAAHAVELALTTPRAAVDFYLHAILPFDFLYPLCYGLSNLILIRYLWKKLPLRPAWGMRLSWLPLIGAGCDWIENGAIGLLYAGIDGVKTILPIVASISFGKWMLSFSSITLISMLLLAVVIRLTIKWTRVRMKAMN